MTTEEYQIEDRDCLCQVHLKAEPDKPCLGHGSKCPCTELLKKEEPK